MDTEQYNFIVLYTGRTIAEARIIAASAAPDLIKLAAERMLHELGKKPDSASNPVLLGRRRALQTAKGGVK